jgi:hypothetical protein
VSRSPYTPEYGVMRMARVCVRVLMMLCCVFMVRAVLHVHCDVCVSWCVRVRVLWRAVTAVHVACHPCALQFMSHVVCVNVL